MRAIFTQFSFLLGVLVALNTNATQPSTLVSISWGLAVGCTVYLVLLLGDFSIHRLLESSKSGLVSATFKEAPVDLELFADGDSENTSQIVSNAASSSNDTLAA